jgi:hypothetical protein
VTAGEARAPWPRAGDPNAKEMRIALTAQEWRQLRLWAAEDATAIEDVVSRIVRRELEHRPASDY